MLSLKHIHMQEHTNLRWTPQVHESFSDQYFCLLGMGVNKK